MFVEYSSSPKTDSLEHPNNVFEMQNKMSNNLNSFQNHYGRYLRCQNEDTAKSVDPPCDFVGRDSFSELQNAYKNLMDDLTEIENVYEKQSDYNAKTAKVFNENETKSINKVNITVNATLYVSEQKTNYASLLIHVLQRLECNVDSDCNDQLDSTIDTCMESINKCSYETIVSCTDNDGYCPSFCSRYSDSDCVLPL